MSNEFWVALSAIVTTAGSLGWAIAAHQSFRKLKRVTEIAIADRDGWREKYFALKYRVQGTEAVLPEVYNPQNVGLYADCNRDTGFGALADPTAIFGMANRKH